MRRVILVRPQGPRNVGTALRATANFGPAELVLVAKPTQQLLVHPDFVQMAHGVKDRDSKITVVSTLSEALADCTWSVGFTARLRDHLNVADWRDVREQVAGRASQAEERVALVFGNEKHGLDQEAVAALNQVVRIATTGEHDSLNLGVTTALALYDTSEPSRASAGGNRCTGVTGAEREFLKRHVKEALGALAEYPSFRTDIENSVERLFSRADLETRDARAWHAVMRRLGNRGSPEDYGLDL